MRFHVVLLSAFILFLAGFPVAGCVEAPGIAWSKTYGGKNSERAYAMVETSDGGIRLSRLHLPSNHPTGLSTN